MPKCDVAIVGGGVIGWSVAYHLLEREPSLRVFVIEKQPASGMGSTGRAAGGVRAQFGTKVNIQLSQYSIEFFKKHKQEVGFHQYGYLFLTAKAAGAQYLEKVSALQKSLGVHVSRLTRGETERLAPYLNTSDILTANFSPADGYLDPYSVCKLFESEAKKLGAIPYYNVRATACETNSISTSDGAFRADTVVLAVGHWTPELAPSLPIDPHKHQLAVAGDIPQLPARLPMVVDLDTSFHFRREGEGLLIGYNDDPPRAEDLEDPSFDYSFLEKVAPIGLHRLPLLETAGFDTKKSWAGYYAETPDRHACIGVLDGVIVATGFGGHGIMQSPAAGVTVAEIALHGAAKTVDVSALAPQRFATKKLIEEPMVI